ncbi:hypothetical protein I7I50_03064 [Histoplasma capsulatum G186AR]|uniref:Uncharacterized protein n=1 Tax=Ajellomyces capsulatus TaxID=5037 RepID=A0A8H8D5L8_AJECA|nr:hypothetical protein I7I52_00269 [Histoplasma capsulatum]QSS72018.1 hypothetical protein I7I50_03064 [Histoplasma capsulatum G186AR]
MCVSSKLPPSFNSFHSFTIYRKAQSLYPPSSQSHPSSPSPSPFSFHSPFLVPPCPPLNLRKAALPVFLQPRQPLLQLVLHILLVQALRPIDLRLPS